MPKINPINNIKPIIQKAEKSKILSKNTTIPYELGAAAIGATGVTLSTFFKDFNKTVEEDNYFQLKINPETEKPFEPDVFQKTAGMHLYNGNDVLVTAPTGTGKTAIAEYVISKNLKNGGRTFYTTPLKALSNEKFLDFSKIYGEENVGLITGDTKININAPIIIMTTEVYRNMAASGKFNFDTDNSKGVPKDLKTVIFDELQYLGDKDRGGIWEQSIMFTPPKVQILSLSATIGNNIEINDWIASTKSRKGIAGMPYKNSQRTETVLINVPSENRHVPLNFQIEHASSEIKVPRGGTKAEKIKAKKEGARISQTMFAKPRDEAFKDLTKKLYEENKLPAIYFIFNKKDSKHMLKYLSTESVLLTNEQEQKEIEEIIKKYDYLGESLNIEALKKGYAIHNAGLLPAQKSLIEELFQKKLVKVVIATETLSAGINMPAKTTVISSPRKPSSTSDGGQDNKRNLTANEFHQMAGRAGRRGIDTVGYCYPISCNKEQRTFYENLIKSTSNDLESNLELDFSFIANYLSEFHDEEEIKYILKKSLYTYNNPEKLNKIIESFDIKKEILRNNRFIDSQGKLTTKGQMLKHLNGYEQVPLINIISNKLLADLNPKQIAGVIGALANIEWRSAEIDEKKNKKRTFSINSLPEECSDKILAEVNNYMNQVSKLHPGQEFKFETKILEHLHKWAELNDSFDNSRKNWKELYSGELRSSIRDEGSLFKEISMTVDLLKQIIEVAECGNLYSDIEEDKIYYNNLIEKCRKALELIQREPVNPDSI